MAYANSYEEEGFWCPSCDTEIADCPVSCVEYVCRSCGTLFTVRAQEDTTWEVAKVYNEHPRWHELMDVVEAIHNKDRASGSLFPGIDPVQAAEAKAAVILKEMNIRLGVDKFIETLEKSGQLHRKVQV